MAGRPSARSIKRRARPERQARVRARRARCDPDRRARGGARGYRQPADAGGLNSREDSYRDANNNLTITVREEDDGTVTKTYSNGAVITYDSVEVYDDVENPSPSSLTRTGGFKPAEYNPIKGVWLDKDGNVVDAPLGASSTHPNGNSQSSSEGDEEDTEGEVDEDDGMLRDPDAVSVVDDAVGMGRIRVRLSDGAHGGETPRPGLPTIPLTDEPKNHDPDPRVDPDAVTSDGLRTAGPRQPGNVDPIRGGSRIELPSDPADIRPRGPIVDRGDGEVVVPPGSPPKR